MPEGSSLDQRRRRAVELRLAGISLAEIRKQVGLSNPTIIKAHKAFVAGGWTAVSTRSRGRRKGAGAIPEAIQREIQQQLSILRPEVGHPDNKLWCYQYLQNWLSQAHGIELNLRTLARYASRWELAPPPLLKKFRNSSSAEHQHWINNKYRQFADAARKNALDVFWLGVKKTALGSLIYAHNSKGTLFWLSNNRLATIPDYLDFMRRLTEQAGRPVALVVHGVDLTKHPELTDWLDSHHFVYITALDPGVDKADRNIPNKNSTSENLSSRDLPMSIKSKPKQASTASPDAVAPGKDETAQLMVPNSGNSTATLTHLQRLEAESLYIMREVIAEADNPVMLYSIGKDSAVMMHLAMKAFYPAKPPFPLLHIDTTWKFKEMYEFRDKMVADLGFELLIHTNQEGIEKGVNPFTHGSALHTDIMKTEALKQALEEKQFDVAFAGARRDEEKSRAKERIFSFRSDQHRWDPKNQRPELWKLYNTRKRQGESMRVFPLSNWTELDIWQYIHLEQIPVVPLYYAAERPVVERDGSLIMVDDERMPLKSGEVPTMRQIRFRTLGCYPLTGALESNATTLPEIIAEMLIARTSERQGRLIDHDSAASMEKKKQDGYF